jgi:TPR repeat protein
MRPTPWGGLGLDGVFVPDRSEVEVEYRQSSTGRIEMKRIALFVLLCLAVPVFGVELATGSGGVASASKDVVAAGLDAFRAGNYPKALKYLCPLADQGNAEAQAGLGFMYAIGKGVPKDDKEAAKWYRLAADQGNVFAQFSLAGMYDAGEGVPQDYKEAVKWYRLAADQGNVDAQLFLGAMYDQGKGVPQDYVLAYMWYDLAYAPTHHILALKYRDEAAAQMTQSEIEQARAWVREWTAKHPPRQ